ncbi:MAG TPA: hypothetical protein VKV73_00020 [Chloroflexota bacterium]|nr:hypothetical protein [Chloroflexota bacterium]
MTSRLCQAQHAESRALWSPLRKRAGKLYRAGRAFRGQGWALDFPAVVVAWLDGSAPTPVGGERPKIALGFLSARMHAIAASAGSGNARQLVSAPTHAGGWIDPEVLVTRLTAERAPNEYSRSRAGPAAPRTPTSHAGPVSRRGPGPAKPPPRRSSNSSMSCRTPTAAG